MAQVHVDFTNLQEFQGVLQQNIERFTDIDSRTKGTLNSYEWNDPVAEKFKEEFEIGMKPILQLKEEMEGFIPWLQAKVDALMKYQGM
ncbi:MAG: hypothetical protein FWD60_04395 [Candidatus Azobacteroides sp.]|nr:hypothetical protein [Candidatus Azobacteroides sp.]